VYRLLVVGDAPERAREWARCSAGLLQVDFQLLPAALQCQPEQQTLIDIRLDDFTKLLALKTWLGGKPQNGKVVVAVDKGSRLQETRAHTLGATTIIHRPVMPEALLRKIREDDGAKLVALGAVPDGAFTPRIVAAGNSLQGILSAACTGALIEPAVVQSAGDAVIDELEAQGVSSWIEKVRSHHSQTYQHSLLVTGVAVAFGEHIGVSRKDRHRLATAGILHDIGKARIPLAILEKPGPLDESEMTLMRNHPEYGLAALGDNPAVPAEMLDIIVHHHELLDGSGYPHGLKGSEISDLVRIMTISDIFGALLERRSYKPPLSSEAAYQILVDMGPRLDRDLVRAFKFVSGVDRKAAA
jgi:putative nucleotidyltransferase with HDIG domain